MITRHFCSICGKTFLDEKECAEHEERSHAPRVEGIHWTGSLELCEGSAYWFIASRMVWLQSVFYPNQDMWAVTDIDGNDIEAMVCLDKPTILSKLSIIDHSVKFQMFTLGKCSEEDVVPKMRALAKDYLKEVQHVAKDLLPATKEVKDAKKRKASKAGSC